MRALEVVRVHVVRDATLAVGEVREHRPRQHLRPERLPESLDLAECLRMLRPRLHVRDPFAAQFALEVRLAPPRRVLPTLIGEDLARRTVARDPATQRLHHELAPLVVRDRVRHEEARVIVHERRHVEPLVSTEEEREDVRLPELVRLRALEATHRMIARAAMACRLDQSGFVQHATHFVLVHAERLEPREHVADPPRAPLGMLSTRLEHRIAPRGRCDRGGRSTRRRRLDRHERILSAPLVQTQPVRDRRRRDPERRRRPDDRRTAFRHRLHNPQARLERVGDPTSPEQTARRTIRDPLPLLLRHRHSSSASSADSGQQR